MVLAFEMGNEFWIECINMPRQAIATNSVTITFQLEKAGIYMGSSQVMDSLMSGSIARNASTNFRNVDDSELVLGQELSAIKIAVGGQLSLDIGAHHLLFMRGSGH